MILRQRILGINYKGVNPRIQLFNRIFYAKTVATVLDLDLDNIANLLKDISAMECARLRA